MTGCSPWRPVPAAPFASTSPTTQEPVQCPHSPHQQKPKGAFQTTFKTWNRLTGGCRFIRCMACLSGRQGRWQTNDILSWGCHLTSYKLNAEGFPISLCDLHATYPCTYISLCTAYMLLEPWQEAEHRRRRSHGAVCSFP